MNSLMKLLASLLLFMFSFLLFGGIDVAESASQNHPFSGRNKLFVFGDSYVDIGNTDKKTNVSSWHLPYGMTYPGEPSGRFSDGHISTDFLAQLLRIKLPVNYAKKDDVDKTRLQYGMSFAYGGTGVFNTYERNYPNMTVQINLFEQLLGNVYSPSDLSSSVALVSVAGNDYITFLAGNSSIYKKAIGIRPFIKQVVTQTEVNLRRIHTLGVKKIAIPSLTPLQYIPLFANSSNPLHDIIQLIVKDLVSHHNDLLQKSVAKLNSETNQSAFTIIDYYNAFLTVFNNKGEIPGILPFKTPYIECLKGKKLCKDPRSAFFWDGIHLTQEGWKSVYKVLRHNITAALMPKA